MDSIQTFESSNDDERKVKENFIIEASSKAEIDAIITSKPDDGQYVVDIYGNGFDADVTLKDITAFSTNANDNQFLLVNKHVLVTLRRDGVAFIVRRGVPYGGLRWMVLQILDGNGTVGWDYPRFW